MAALETALVARAAATTALVTAIGTRFYNGIAQQNVARPYVVFDLIGGSGRTRAFGNGQNCVWQRVQFTVVAQLASQEVAVHAALLAAFDFYAGTIGGTEILHGYAEGGRVILESAEAMPDTRVTSQDFIFAYRE